MSATSDESSTGLPDIIGECTDCQFKIHRGSVEERLSLLAQEGEDADIDDIALNDADLHERVCDGEVEWESEWEIQSEQTGEH